MIVTTHDIIPRVVALAGEFYRESERALPFDPVIFSTTVADFITNEDCCVIVHDYGSEVRGFLLGICSQYPAAAIVQANELLWYSPKRHRGTGALRMFVEFQSWAVDQGAKIIFSGAFEGRAAKYYQRVGFSKLNEKWVRVI